MTWIILFLALLALIAGRTPERSAPPSSLHKESADAAAPALILEERHTTDDGLSPQPLLSRPGELTGKARPTMIRIAQAARPSWQDGQAALNMPELKDSSAIDARTLSDVMIACATDRAL